jgi:predicted O-methyltransferase YrrM
MGYRAAVTNSPRRLSSLLRRRPPAQRAYPDTVAVNDYSRDTVEFLRGTGCRVIAEVGIYQGHTSMEIAKWLHRQGDGRGELHLYDFHDTVEQVGSRVAEAYPDVTLRTFGNTYRHLDSYNWPLGQMLEQHTEPIYDFVFIDGAHTWAVDALTTLLADRLLRPGGYIAQDDYDWTLWGSPSMNPKAFPRTAEQYTEEQMKAQQVRMICDLLLRRDDRYEEVLPNRIWRKARA